MRFCICGHSATSTPRRFLTGMTMLSLRRFVAVCHNVLHQRHQCNELASLSFVVVQSWYVFVSRRAPRPLPVEMWFGHPRSGVLLLCAMIHLAVQRSVRQETVGISMRIRSMSTPSQIGRRRHIRIARQHGTSTTFSSLNMPSIVSWASLLPTFRRLIAFRPCPGAPSMFDGRRFLGTQQQKCLTCVLCGCVWAPRTCDATPAVTLDLVMQKEIEYRLGNPTRTMLQANRVA